MLKTLRYSFIAILLGAFLMISAACTPDQATPTASSSDTTTTAPSQPANPAPADDFGNLPRLEGTATVELTVNGSSILIDVNGNDAPITAGNFVDLVQRGVYDGTVFHRVIHEPEPFVAQGGDPQSKDPNVPPQALGTGSFIDPATGQARYIPLEIKPEGAEEPLYSQTFEKAGITEPPVLQHTRGAVAMARSPIPDSASAQFYIALADLPFLDGSYAVFGYVSQGMDVVDAIQQGDRLESVRVITGAENLKLTE
jgi:peptidyl-prolyl cis-trans isomerase B (cyclophilin B)